MASVDLKEADSSLLPIFHSVGLEILVRAQLINGSTTVIQMRTDMTIWKVLALICSKKNIPPEHVGNLLIVYDGKEEEADMDLTVEYYRVNLDRIVLVPIEYIDKLKELPPLPQKISFSSPTRRRASIYSQETSVRASAIEFPATVTEKPEGVWKKIRTASKLFGLKKTDSIQYIAPTSNNEGRRSRTSTAESISLDHIRLNSDLDENFEIETVPLKRGESNASRASILSQGSRQSNWDNSGDDIYTVPDSVQGSRAELLKQNSRNSIIASQDSLTSSTSTGSKTKAYQTCNLIYSDAHQQSLKAGSIKS
jgi:hypothetical protein